ncbi:beta strand repeat-containing protein [Mesorhizobium sp. AaZ16]|uniref:beta strand repeat-containing protein n=1 Tax=Mesorhizobium sp. AaZ16 TaxID=3402289 RepID=UPI00374F47C9
MSKVENLTIYVDGTPVNLGDNDPVAITSGVQAGAVVEDGPALTATGNITFDDYDLADTHVVSITGGPASPLGSLTFVTTEQPNTIGGTTAWTYTLNNAAAQYLAQGQSVTETYTVTLDDGHGSTTAETVTVTVTGVNDAPVAVDDTDAGDEDTLITGSVAGNDTDIDDGASLSYALVNPAPAGLTFNANGSYSLDTTHPAYQHLAAGATTDVVVAYTVSDGLGGSDTGQLTVTVTGVNDAPVAVDDTDAGDEDTLITGSVAGNDTDIDDGASLSYALVNPAPAGLTFNANGSYSLDTTHPAYQHLAAGATTDVVVAYTVSDGLGGSDTGQLTVTVTGVNDAPVAVDDTDAGDEDTLITGSVAGNDTDIDDGASLSYALVNPAPAGLTFNANGSYSLDTTHPAYQHLAAGATTDVVVAYTVSDGLGGSDTGQLTVTVTGVNDAPVAVDDTDAGDEDTLITGSVAGNDTDIDDGASLSYALVNPAPAGLTFNANGSYSLDTTHPAYQHLAAGATTDVVVAYTVSDGLGGSDTGQLTVTVTGVNDAPVAVDDTDAGDEDTLITGSVAGNDTDIDDGASLSYALVNPAPAGLTFNANGSYSLDTTHPAYQHLAAGATTDVVVAYTVSDGLGGSDTGQLTVTVTGVNDAPVAVDDTDAGDEDTLITGSVAGNDTDIDDGASLSYALVNPAPAGLTFNANGSYSLDTTHPAYQHLAAGATTDVVVAYTVSDGLGGSDTGQLTVTVTGVNDAPVAVDDTDAGDEDTLITGSVAGNDTDIDDGASLSYALVNPAPAGLTFNANGSYSLDTTHPAYQHLAAGATTDVVVAYTVSDGLGGSDTGQLTVTVTGVNDAPVAVDDTDAGDEDTLITGSVAGNDTDIDDGASLSYALVNPAPAGLTFNANGSYSLDTTHPAYQHLAAGATTDVVVAYTVSDGLGGSDTGQLTVTVTGVNDAPVAVDDTDAGDEDTLITGSVAGNDTDIDDGASLSYALVNPAPAGLTFNANGSYSLDTTHPAYQHLAAGATTDVVVAYTVSDGLGGSDTGQLTVTVTGVNDAPVAVDDTDAGDEDTLITGSVAGNDTDIDDGASLSYALVNPAPAGLTFNANGSYSLDTTHPAYQHLAAGATTDVVVAYTVSDGLGGSDTGQLTVTVTGVNDAPVAVDDTDAGDEDTLITGSVAGNDTDIDDGASLSYALVNPAPAGLTFNANGSYSLDTTHPAYQHLAAGATTDVVVAYTVSDGLGGSDTGQLTVTVTGVNDAPVAVDDTDAGDEDTLITGSVAGNDTDIDDGASLSYALVNPAPAGLTFNANGSYSLDTTHPAYQHLAAGATTDVVVAYTVSDGLGGSDTGQLTVTVTGVNDAPVAVDDTDAGDEDTLITGSVAGNDTDIDDGASLSYALVNPAPAGLTFNANGSYSLDTTHPAYQHLAAGATTDVVVAYTVSDGLGGSDTGQLTVTVTGVNDAPVAVDDTDAGDEDTLITGSVAGNDTDIDDGASLSYALVNPAPAGLTFNANGSYSLDTTHPAYQHLAAGATTDVVVAYTVSDGLGGSDTGQLTVTVTGVNDAPVAVDDTDAGDEDTLITGSVAGNDTDIDDGASLSYALVNPAPAGLTFNANGSYSLDTTHPAYQHLAAGATTDVVVAYTVSDGLGGSDTGQLTVTVTGVNDAPVAVDDTDAGDEDTLITGSVAGNDTDIDDGASLSYALVNPAPAGLTFNANGSYSLDTTHPAYQHLAAGATTDVVVAYTVSDGLGGSDTGQLTVTVTGVNDAPVAVDDTDAGDEDTLITGSVAGNDTDIDDGASLSYALVNPAPAGLTFNANGSYSLDTTHPAYQHLAAGATTDVVVAYTVSDGLGGSDTGQLTVTVTGVNDAPVADLNGGAAGNDATASFIEQTAVVIAPSATISDVDSANITSLTATLGARPDGNTVESLSLNAMALAAAAGLTVTYVQATGVLSITGTAILATYQTILEGIQYNNISDTPNTTPRTVDIVVSDGTDTSISHSVTVGVTPVNDAATDLIFTYTGAPGNSLPNGPFGQMSVVDPDGGAPTYSFSLTGLAATTLTGGVAADFAGDLAVSSTGVISASNLDDNRVYELTVQVTQGAATFSESFSVITGTNAGETVSGGYASGDDVIFAQGAADTVLAGSGNDTVFGQSNNDHIHGGTGNDSLTGGGGDDTFYFDTTLDATTNVDTINDFGANNNDKIWLDNAIFSQLTSTGTLSASTFVSNAGGTAVDGNDYILYDTNNGSLFYDADGSGAGAKMQFATLTLTGISGTVDANDFLVV